ncbi:MAG: hypothetical protein QXX86_06630 [Sulfolobales archaeon]
MKKGTYPRRSTIDGKRVGELFPAHMFLFLEGFSRIFEAFNAIECEQGLQASELESFGDPGHGDRCRRWRGYRKQ